MKTTLPRKRTASFTVKTSRRIVKLFGLQNHAKLTRLVAKWRIDADNQGLLRSDKLRLKGYGEGRRDCLRHCSDELERALKGNTK